MEKIYLGKLDINYFKKCVEDAVKDAKENYMIRDYYNNDLKTCLEVIKNQVHGLRDVFYLFNSDDIEIIMEPVINALNELE